MSEIATMIDEARRFGVELTVDDFDRDGDTLTIDGMPAGQWFEGMFETAPDRLEDREV